MSFAFFFIVIFITFISFFFLLISIIIICFFLYRYLPFIASRKGLRCDVGKQGIPCVIDGSVNTCCEDCTPGKIATTSMNVDASCEMCDKGKSQLHHAQSTCLPCIPGLYSDDLGSVSCLQCDTNTYSSVSGRKKPCINCPKGRSSSKASSSCSACASGSKIEFVNGISICSSCPPGTFSKGTNQINCQNCSSGLYSSLTAAASCLECLPGFYQNEQGSGSCLPCFSGRFRDMSNNECVNCPKGYYQSKIGQASW